MNQILILSNTPSDLSELILRHCPGAALYALTETEIPFENFDAVCILGGAEGKALALPARHRIHIEQARREGKPVFCEFAISLGSFYAGSPIRTTHHRLVYSDEHVAMGSLARGDVLDGHNNDVLSYYFQPGSGKPILTCHDYICAHDHIDMDSERFHSGRWALWMADENTLVSSFRLCNFNRARLAPSDHWHKLIRGILEFLCGETVELTMPAPICRYGTDRKVTSEADVSEAVARGLAWFHRAGMLRDNGAAGVLEGFSHHISAASGIQTVADQIRADCTGETGGAFLLDYLRTGNPDSLAVYNNTADFCFDQMQIKDGPHRGMVRWSETAWLVCYQDDVARAIMPTLIAQSFGGGSPHFADAVEALNYLVSTTAADGLRAPRTDVCNFNDDLWNRLKQTGSGLASAHYNAYYHAALLLATRGGADKRFADTAVKGLSAIMALYPETRRETSETEEMCRLVLPLALLYEYTGEREHYDWLCRVVTDLERVQHPSGGYAEWDTGYKASCARNDQGECALLANNGDPVADLLYSNNWLPMGFAYAYLATGEERFFEKWAETATFMLACQIRSDDPLLDGAWTRAMDMNRLESYGVPHDVGWAPCSIESGWTVGEILMGLQFMTIARRIVSERNS